MDITNQLQNHLQEIIKNISNSEVDEKLIKLDKPNDPSHGDFATNAAMIFAGKLKMNPRELAEKIILEIKNLNLDIISEVSVAGPGFINFKINQNYYSQLFTEIYNDKDFGKGENLKGKRIMVEFAHPNPFKSFHIGHLRNIILGESIVRMLENQGAEVIRTNYQGDVGMHIAKCIWAFRKIDQSEYPNSADEKVQLLGKAYAEGATAFEEDEAIKKEIVEINKQIYSSIKKVNNQKTSELTSEEKQIYELWDLGRKWSLEKFHELYKRVYSDNFAKEYMESEVMETCLVYIQESLDKGILKKSEGAIVFDGSQYGLDTRVFLNSEGLPTYEGKELGLAYREFTDFGKIDLAVHNVAVEQISFFKVTFKVQELLDPELFKGKQYHNAYEFVGLKKGKMSSRKGNVVLGNDILNEAFERVKAIVGDKEDYDNDKIEKIAVGAVKFSFLKISPFKYLAFDFEESLNFEGNSGPYIQYTYARCRSILAKSQASGNAEGALNEEEIDLVKHLAEFPDLLKTASKEYSPNLIAIYLFDLCQIFNKFYTKHQIIGSEKETLRIQLTDKVSQVLNKGLELMGIMTVEKM